MLTMTHIIIVLAVIWLTAMAWMRIGSTAKQPKWIQTTSGGAWIICNQWPSEGESVRGYGYHGIEGVDYNSALALDGKLQLKNGRYIWLSSGRRPYISR